MKQVPIVLAIVSTGLIAGVGNAGVAPPNDDCANAVVLDVPPGGSDSAKGTTVGATIDPVPFCGTSVTAPGVWYTVVGTGNTMTASTCNAANYDTKISIYCGDCPNGIQSLNCVAGLDDTAGCAIFTTELPWCSQAGVVYRILIHGFVSATGTFTLTVSDDDTDCTGAVECVPPPTGACCNCEGTDITCDIMTEADCAAAAGVYLGDDTVCTGSSFESNPKLAIPDNNPTGVSDTITVNRSFTISDLNVDLSIDHTWVGDLCVTLEHGPTTILLIARPGADTGAPCHDQDPFGCSLDNYVAIFLDDEGVGGPIETQCTANLTSPPNYTPNGALSAFDGADASGDWTISVVDRAAGDLGTLVTWSLHFGDGTGTPCTTAVICEPGTEGCSLGFWKNHTELWEDYDPDDLFVDVFGTNPFPGMTLHEVISQPSGPPAPGTPPQLRNLGKQTVAALLNAAAVDFGMTPAQVISAFNLAYNSWLADGDLSHLTTLQGIFGDMNSLGCPSFNFADINHDMVVDIADLMMLFNEWNRVKSSADIIDDGIVNERDLRAMFTQWGRAPVRWNRYE